MDTLDKYDRTNSEAFQRVSVLDVYAARLLMFSFFLPEKLQSFVTILVGVYFVFRSFRAKFSVPRSNYLWAALLGSLYFLYLFSIPFTPPEYKHFLSLLCERKLSLLLLPLVFALTGQPFRLAIINELRFFVYGCLVSCMVGNADFVYHSWLAHDSIHALSHVRYRIIFESCTGIHPTYMGVFLGFSICITLLSTAFVGRRGQVMQYAIVYVLLVLLLALLAKSPIIALIFIGGHYAYRRRQALLRYKMALAGFFASVIAACFFIPFIGQRLREVLQFAGIGKSGNVADNSVYVRKLLWTVDTDLIKQYWLTGVGAGRLLHILRERYFFYSIANHFPVGYFDPHNEYFSEWLSFGLLGIAVFVTMLTVHFVRAIRMRHYLYLYMLIILYITFSTETLLSRQEGVLFYSVFTSLFFFSARRLEDRR